MQITKNEHVVLLGEDDLEVRSYLAMALKCRGYSVVLAEDGEEVLSLLRGSEAPISAVLLDILMPNKNGIETLKEIRRINQALPVIMVSGASSPLHVVETMKNGANDFIPKPVDYEELCRALRNALVPASAPPLESPAPAPATQIHFGTSPAMQGIHEMVARVGLAEAPVLIQGETGAGKEVLARELHAQSRRARKPFLKLNCAALPSELVESELFGYERGAFTGAFQKKPGMFELADGGTILLDEIGDMDIKLQAKLLQVLQDQEFQRLGGKETVRVDVRVIAATHRDLEKAVTEGTFREDLYYRLNVISFSIPPLRERKEDILPLAERLLRKHAPAGTALPVITAPLRQAFQLYDWPGNIRELENVVRRLLILRDQEMLARELSARFVRRSAPQTVPQLGACPNRQIAGEATVLEQVTKAKQEAEKTAILAVLNSTRWNRKRAAAVLKIDYKALLYKMKKLEIVNKPAAAQRAVEAPPQERYFTAG